MNKIIVCIDGSISALSACDIAAWSNLRLGCPVELLHVLEKSNSPAQEDLSGNIGLGSREQLLTELAELDRQRSRLMLDQGRLMLNEARRRIELLGVDKNEVTTLQRHDRLVDTLKELEDDTRLLIIGRSGEAHENETVVIGSHLENAIRTLDRPILVALPDFTPPERFLLAYDASATANKALQMVAKSPLLKGVPCHLVMAGDVSEKQSSSMNEAEQVLLHAGFHVTCSRVGGEVVEELIAYAAKNGIGLLVMGAYGHSRIRQFLVGSTTTQMLLKSRVPLLLLR